MKIKSIILLLTLGCCCANVFAQSIPLISKGDRALLRKYKKIIERDWFGEYDQRNPTASMDDGLIFDSNDKKFKMFIFRGEDCGAHCNVFYDAFLHVNAIKPNAYHIRLYPVTHIYKLKDNKYLILQKGDDGGGNLQEDCLQATLISLKGNKMTEHPIKYPLDAVLMQKSFLITQSSAVVEDEEEAKENFKLKYNPVAKQLSYAYLEANENGDKVYRCVGKFTYVNGEFVFNGQTKSELP